MEDLESHSSKGASSNKSKYVTTLHYFSWTNFYGIIQNSWRLKCSELDSRENFNIRIHTYIQAEYFEKVNLSVSF